MPLINFKKIEKEEIKEIENLIIGSGAGGSTIGYELFKQGKEALILEEGPNIDVIESDNIGRNIINLYKNNGATPLISSNGGPLIGFGQGSCVGGSTYVNAGYFSNTPEWIFENWMKDKKTILKFEEFQRYIKDIKNEMNISLDESTSKNNDSKFLFERSKNLNWKIDSSERFSTGVSGVAKQNMNNTYHKTLLKNKIDIIYNCKVEKIISKNGIASEVITKKIDNKFAKFKFKNLFINCGPINTPSLIIKNNLLNNNEINENFEFHINFKILVKFKKEINSNFDGKYNPDIPISLYFMREFEKEGALLSCSNTELPYMMATASHFNDDIKKDIYLNRQHYAMFIYQIKSDSIGKIYNLHKFPIVKYKFNEKDIDQIKKAILRISNFFLNDEIEFILYPLENSLPIKNTKDAEILSNDFNYKKLHLVSVHGMSSMRSNNSSNSPTDYFGKLKGFQNIFINDASILPGNTGESPQASIMAFSKFFAENLKL